MATVGPIHMVEGSLEQQPNNNIEAMALMGMPYSRCVFRQAIFDGKLQAAHVRSFAGNGMDTSSAAAAFIWGMLQIK